MCKTIKRISKERQSSDCLFFLTINLETCFYNMQIVDSNNTTKTFNITPEVANINDIWLVRFIDVNTGDVRDNFGNATDLGYCFQLEVLDFDGFMTEGSTYTLEVYSLQNLRLAYRGIVKNIPENSLSERYSNNFETI